MTSEEPSAIQPTVDDRAEPPVRRDGYRPHLDGIRAVAVAMVIAFHLGYEWIPGGFVGVDVFFVLSGYLITGILLHEATGTGAVRLGRFFARRVRRLLPASIAVLGAVLLATRWLLDAVQRHDVAADARWAALYAANWRFASRGGDYFAPGDVPSPLVHYWSLAVEEQFYLVWPLLVAALAWAARRRGHRPAGVVLGVAAVLGLASAIASVALVGSPTTYYGTHARAYQLLAGAALAALVRWRPTLDRGDRPATSRLGRRSGPVLVLTSLTVLAWSAHGIDGAGRYPGWPGVVVTLASVVLIAGLDLTPPGLHQRALGAGVLAAVGRWSYSLYIWHWPVVVLAPVVALRWDRAWIGGRPAMLVLIAALAGLSYHLVERPVRFRLVPSARPRLVVAIGLACSVLLAGLAHRSSSLDATRRAAYDASRDLAAPGDCPYDREAWPAPSASAPCLWRDGTGPTIALVGDSHAQQWQPSLEVLAERTDARIVRVTRVSCPAPDVTIYTTTEEGRREDESACTEWRRAIYPRLVEQFDPDVVLVATRGYVSGIVTDDGRHLAPSDPEHLTRWRDGWAWTLDALTAGGATVVLSTILPTLPERVPACLIDHGSRDGRCDFPLAGDERVGAYNEVIDALPQAHEGVVVVDPVSFVCPDGICPAVIDGLIVHRDGNHLTASFARARADELAELAARAGADLTGGDATGDQAGG